MNWLFDDNAQQDMAADMTMITLLIVFGLCWLIKYFIIVPLKFIFKQLKPKRS